MVPAMRSRGQATFAKPPLSHEQLVCQLERRGLIVPDRGRALRYIRHLGYYRLSPYTIPFQQDRTQHLFQNGVEFDDVLGLYVFDRKLRLLCLDAIERVEVAVRTALTDHMSTSYGDAHWYTNQRHFADKRQHQMMVDSVREAVHKRLQGMPESGHDAMHHRSALEHYLLTYGEPELPPSWLTMESLTIGQLSSIYRNLRDRRDRTEVASSVGLPDPILASWLQAYVRVRNICAHHGRLWNAGLGVYPKIPTSPRVSWFADPSSLPSTSQKRLYPVLASLQSVLDTISPRSRWADRLRALLEGCPEMYLHGMGVPLGWAQDPFWSGHFTSADSGPVI